MNLQKLRFDDFYDYIEFNVDSKTERIFTRHLYKKEKNLEFEEKAMGSFIVEILNNYDKIMNAITNCENIIKKAKKDVIYNSRLLRKKFKDKSSNEYIQKRKELAIDFNDTCINSILSLKTKFYKIDKKLSIYDAFLQQYIVHLIDTYNNQFNKYTMKKLKEDKENQQRKKAYHNFRKRFHRNPKNYYKSVVTYSAKQIKIFQELSFMADKYLKIPLDLKSHLEDTKTSIDTAFIHNCETRNNKFSGILNNLPTCKIEYETEYVKYPQPLKYTYKFGSFRELVTITIYQLSLNHKVIIKCKNCGKYLIPDRTDQIYCNENCKWRYMTRKSKENESETYSYYRKLYNRYKNGKTYEKEFEELKSIYYNQYKSKQLDDEAFMQLLLDFEHKVKNAHTVKRGRPKKQ